MSNEYLKVDFIQFKEEKRLNAALSLDLCYIKDPNEKFKNFQWTYRILLIREVNRVMQENTGVK